MISSFHFHCAAFGEFVLSENVGALDLCTVDLLNGKNVWLVKNEIDVSTRQDPQVFVSFFATMSGVALNGFQARGAEVDHRAGRAGPRQLEAGAVPRHHLAGLLLLRVEGGQVHGEGEPSASTSLACGLWLASVPPTPSSSWSSRPFMFVGKIFLRCNSEAFYLGPKA